MAREFKPSPLALAVLTLLHEQPMHVYRMQKLIKERGKDQVINVEQRASLYQTINQLQRAGLIAFWETDREEGFPERTLYKLTEKGRVTALEWLREMISNPAQEYPIFPAAISLLPLLSPADTMQQLALRADKLSARILAIDEELRRQTDQLSRLFLLEAEYLRNVLVAELTWVRAVMADLKEGQLTWNDAWAHPFEPPTIED